MKTGDVVLVKDENQSRGDWRLGRIESINESDDRQTRSALLTVISKGGRRGNIRRGVRALYPLEIRDVSIKAATDLDKGQNNVYKLTSSRPKCEAKTLEELKRIFHS